MKQTAQSEDLHVLIERTATGLAARADASLKNRDVTNGLLLLVGAVSLAIAPVFIDAALERIKHGPRTKRIKARARRLKGV